MARSSCSWASSGKYSKTSAASSRGRTRKATTCWSTGSPSMRLPAVAGVQCLSISWSATKSRASMIRARSAASSWAMAGAPTSARADAPEGLVQRAERHAVAARQAPQARHVGDPPPRRRREAAADPQPAQRGQDADVVNRIARRISEVQDDGGDRDAHAGQPQQEPEAPALVRDEEGRRRDAAHPGRGVARDQRADARRLPLGQPDEVRPRQVEGALAPAGLQAGLEPPLPRPPHRRGVPIEGPGELEDPAPREHPVRLHGVSPGGRLPVEPAVAGDVPSVVHLIGRVFAEYGFVFDPPTELPDLFAFERHYTAPRGAFFVVRDGGAIVGSVGVERLDEGRAELHRLYLDVGLRGRGTGRALAEAVIDWCRAQSIGHLVLWSDTRFDRAHVLYERMGFVKTGERTLPDDPNATREFRYERPV